MDQPRTAVLYTALAVRHLDTDGATTDADGRHRAQPEVLRERLVVSTRSPVPRHRDDRSVRLRDQPERPVAGEPLEDPRAPAWSEDDSTRIDFVCDFDDSLDDEEEGWGEEPFGQDYRLREVIEDHVDFERVPDLLEPGSPRLVVIWDWPVN